jgi:blue copper oxidase
MGINGKPFDLGRLDITVSQGDTEIWEMRGTDMAHPLHIHGATFTVLHLDGSPPPPHLTGPKDTVLINEKAELLVSFDRTANSANPFVFHCQILEHADAGMMASYVVV